MHTKKTTLHLHNKALIRSLVSKSWVAVLLVVFLCTNTGLVAAQATGDPGGYHDCDTLRAIGADFVQCAPSCDSSVADASTTVDVPAGTLPAFVPEPYNGAFTEGANKHNVAPALVAGIFSEEHNLGNSETSPNTANLPSAWANFLKQHPDPNSGWTTSGANAQGPFQFLPSTWTNLGYNISDINNLVTAADAAAKYLASNGGTVGSPEQPVGQPSLANAIYDYNHASWYVNAALEYYHYYNGQPGATPSGGSTVITTAASASSSCACSSGGASSTAPASPSSPTIVLDPGHAPSADIKIDPTTNLAVDDYENPQEMQQVWDISQQLTTQLKQAGYNVLNTKQSEADTSTDLKKRAEVGNQANAALGVSIHASPGGNSQDTVFVPEVGNWRLTATSKDVTTPYTPSASTTPPTGPGYQALVYNNASLAATDLQDGKLMASARSQAEDGVNVRVGGYSELINSYLDRSQPGEYTMNGTMTTTQYFATIPWLYNEQFEDAGAGAMTAATEQKYETGLLKGIEAIVPINTASNTAAATGSCSVDCTNPSNTTQTLSPVRQSVVCLAQQELALWESQPGYPHPSYSKTGYLKYSQDRPEEWCADFVSWVYDQAQYPLYPDPKWNINNVANVQSDGEKNLNFHWHPAGSGYTPKPGDIAIHGGDHTNIYISSNGNSTTYIGGDQGSGPYPGGSIVSIETGSGYYDNGITGYVSPD